MKGIHILFSNLQGVVAIVVFFVVVFLMGEGVRYVYKNRDKGIEFIKHYRRILLFMSVFILLFVVSDTLLRSDFCPKGVASTFCSSGQFALVAAIGAFIALLSCWACLSICQFMRIWLHRKISRMSYTFAVLSCSVVIATPLMVSVPILYAIEHQDIFSCLLPEETEKLNHTEKSEYKKQDDVESCDKSLVDRAVNGYFYAIHQANGEDTLRFGENTVSLFFGLIGYLIFSGYTVSMFVNMVGTKQRRIEQGEEHYANIKRHYIVIGSGKLLESLVKSIDVDFTLKRESKIIILTSEAIPELRKRLSANLPKKCLNRIIFIHGDRTNEEDLRKLCVGTCERIYLMGDFGAADQDDRNLVSLQYINKIIEEQVTIKCRGKDNYLGWFSSFAFIMIPFRKRQKRIFEVKREEQKEKASSPEFKQFDPKNDGEVMERKPCKIYLERYHSLSLFQGLIKDSKLGMLTVEPVCFYKHWAEIVMGIRQNNSGIDYRPFDGTGITSSDDDSFVHLVIIGMSSMGIILATEAAKNLHFPNCSRKRTRITMIDENAYREMCSFTNLYQNVFANAHYMFTSYDDAVFDQNVQISKGMKSKVMNRKNAWLDTEFHFIQGNAEGAVIRELLVSYAKEPGVKLVIAVCLQDDGRALAFSLSLPRCVLYADSSAILEGLSDTSRNLPTILVQQQSSAGLLGLLMQQHYLDNVRPFGMMDEAVGEDAECDKLAMYLDMCYNEDNVEWNRASLMDKFGSKMNVTKAQNKWKSCQEWKRISNRYAMASRYVKLRSFGKDMHDDHYLFSRNRRSTLEAMAEVEHNRWCMEKLMSGYNCLSIEDRITLDALGIGSKSWKYKAQKLKSRFIHPALRPWQEIISTDYRKVYYTHTINTCIGICLMDYLSILADKSLLPEDSAKKVSE